MFGPKELDTRNVYNPDLQNIQESAERTYGEANSFYRKEELYLKDIESRIISGELSSEKDIYDECHAIASDLAKCCEMYLKALYIFEHNIPGKQIDELWDRLKNAEYKTDANGQLIYMTPSGITTFAKYDSDGNPIKDVFGKVLYFDSDGNVYNENNRGSKIKRNGHQLDRLIELMSNESQVLLETRMLMIPMSSTEDNSSISVLDVLLEKGLLSLDQQISQEQYNGWIEQHKKTFEEARYSGQKQYPVNVEFLYHLATQIRAVVQFKMDPKNTQKFTLTDEELAKLPKEIRLLVALHSNLMSEELIKLIINDDEIKSRVISLLSNQDVLLTTNLSPSMFLKMIKLMSNEEIIYVSHLSYIVQNYNSLERGTLDEKTTTIVEFLRTLGLVYNVTMEFFIQLKESFGQNIDFKSENFEKMLRFLRNKVAHGIYDEEALKDLKKDNVDNRSYVNKYKR